MIIMVNNTIFESFLYIFNSSASSHSFFSDQIAYDSVDIFSFLTCCIILDL